jgi:hypothetical protein
MSDLSSFAQLAAQAASSIHAAHVAAILAQPPAPAPKSWRAALDEAARAMAAQRAKEEAAEAARMQAQLDALTPDLKTVLEYLGIDAQPAHGQVKLDNIIITLRAKLEGPISAANARLEIRHTRPAQWDQDDDDYDAYEGAWALTVKTDFQLDTHQTLQNRAAFAGLIERLEENYTLETERRARLAERRQQPAPLPAPQRYRTFMFSGAHARELDSLLNDGWEVVSMSMAAATDDLQGLVILRNTRL